MRTLFLSSKGLRNKLICEEFVKILPDKPENLRLVHILTATTPYKDEDKGFLESDRKAIKDAGFQFSELYIEGKDTEFLIKELKNKDIIYVQGGNTFYLMKHLRLSGLDKLLPGLLEQGMVYFGTSAGSYVAGMSIETGRWKKRKPQFGLTDLSGVKLVPFSVFAHYEESHNSIIRKNLKTLNHPLKILTDDQALLVRGEKIELVGKGEEINPAAI